MNLSKNQYKSVVIGIIIIFILRLMEVNMRLLLV